MKKGSKLIFCVCLAIGLTMVFTGCASSPVITDYQDISTDWQEHAMLCMFYGQWSNNAQVRIQGVDDVIRQLVSPMEVNKIALIPSGTHTITFIINGQQGGPGTRDFQFNQTITYEFQPGGRYVLYCNITDRTYLLEKADSAIYTLEDFQPVYIAQRNPVYSAEQWDANGYSFEDFVVARFKKVEAALSK